MHRIALVGLCNSHNLGDPLICETAQYLISEVMNRRGEPFVVDKIDLLPSELKGKGTVGKHGQRLSALLARMTKDNHLAQHWVAEYYLKRSKFFQKHVQYFSDKLENYDLVIFAGGGLIKYKQQEKINQSIAAAVTVAEKLGIPVAFHSVGVEGYNLRFAGCRRLDKAINSPNTIVVSTRDDLDTLETKYKRRKDLIVMNAADSAVWTSEFTGISRDVTSNVIGIGIVRANIFKNYGISLTEKQVLNLYVNIVKELESRNESWMLFCNGFKPDYDFGLEVLRKLRKTKKKLVRRPKDYLSFVQDVSQFKGTIVARLHACITSYALDVPVVGLVWNDKVRFFGEDIGVAHRFFDPKDFDPKAIVDACLGAIDEGYDQKRKETYKKTSLHSIETIIESYLAFRKK